MTKLYPEIVPYDHGFLDVGDHNQIYWETCGNPHGKPAIVLHGGPGSGCTESVRRYFDPQVYRVVLFDQRNCGRSLPHASDPHTDLSTNTTVHLLADIENLRQYLGIERWLLFGGSWGSTLALAYAESYPERVSEIVLFDVTMTRHSEIDWLYRVVAPLFPEQYARFRTGSPAGTRDEELVAAYYRLMQHPNLAVRTKAAQDWIDWELSILLTDPDSKPGTQWNDPDFRMAWGRIVTHYFHHKAWLEDGVLLRNASALAGIPGVMVHGRLDLDAPLVTAWELGQAWPDAEVEVIPNAGHSYADERMAAALIAATDRFAGSR